MPGQRGSEQRNLTKQVGIRLTEEEYERLLDEAQAAGLTLAALTRRRLLGLHITAQVDAELIRELRRLGGLAKIAIRTPGMAEHGRLALDAIRRANRASRRAAVVIGKRMDKRRDGAPVARQVTQLAAYIDGGAGGAERGDVLAQGQLHLIADTRSGRSRR